MVVRSHGPQQLRAFVVPDEGFWTMRGVDLPAVGYAPAETTERADVVIVPERVPDALADALREAWSRMSPPRRFVALEGGLAGDAAALLLADDGRVPRDGGGHGGGDGHGGDHDHGEGHDHEDMMAIVGDPSSDGLVMESIDLELGPLTTALPGGLVVSLRLDGDVVVDCVPRGRLRGTTKCSAPGAGDPSTSAARSAAILAAGEHARGEAASESARRVRIAAMELERALAHAAWLRSFGRVLGWSELVERGQQAVGSLVEARGLAQRALLDEAEEGWRDDVDSALVAATRPLARLQRLLEGSRRLRARTRGRAPTAPERLAPEPIGGPVARAAGLPRDARLSDDLYEALGLRVERRDAGDVEARALVRAAEADGAVALARAALAEVGGGAPATTAQSATPAVVEGPRGPITATVDGAGEDAVVTVPGATETLALAGASVYGLELASALVGLASFDLSPWSASS